MGFFSFLLGTGEHNSHTLSHKQRRLSRQEIRDLVSRVKVKSLSSTEENIIEKRIDNGRFGDGKISLQQIDEILGRLVYEKKISKYDRRDMLKVFQDYFEKRTP